MGAGNGDKPATLWRIAEYGGTIPVVQDSTGVNYNTHQKTEGTGYISDKTRGSTFTGAWRWFGTGWFWGYWSRGVTTGKKPKTNRPVMTARMPGNRIMLANNIEITAVRLNHNRPPEAAGGKQV
jgi:hypothetical protein